MDNVKLLFGLYENEYAATSANKTDGCGPEESKPRNFCKTDFDSLLCWPRTSPGTYAILPCFSQLNGIKYDTSQNATRFCLPNGEWVAYSDYSACQELPSSSHGARDLLELTTTIYLVGYCLSLAALLVAVYIFRRYKCVVDLGPKSELEELNLTSEFKDLRCLRNSIHMNLMVSYICADFVWILTFLVQVFALINLASCVLFTILLHYFHLANFFWMFVEGLYLYILVVKTFRGDKIKLYVCVAVGWGGPVLFVIVWGLAKGAVLHFEDNLKLVDTMHICTWRPHVLDWIYQFPVILVLLVNLIFLIIIMWVLITKLRSANTVETQQYRKAAKALLVLMPLLGITYIFVLFGPSEGVPKNIYECLRAVLLSTQGFTVAVFYCFLNTEVKNTVGHHLNAWNTHRSLGSQRSHRYSSRDYTQRSRDSLRLYQAVNFFKKRESTVSAGTTTSMVGRNSSQKTRP